MGEIRPLEWGEGGGGGGGGEIGQFWIRPLGVGHPPPLPLLYETLVLQHCCSIVLSPATPPKNGIYRLCIEMITSPTNLMLAIASRRVSSDEV